MDLPLDIPKFKACGACRRAAALTSFMMIGPACSHSKKRHSLKPAADVEVSTIPTCGKMRRLSFATVALIDQHEVIHNAPKAITATCMH